MADLDSKPLSPIRYYSDKVKARIEMYRDMLRGYPIPTVTLFNSDLATATEIFTRINTSGKTLTAFQIISAKVYQEGKFDLVEKREAQENKWEKSSYGKIPDMTVLQGFALCLHNSCKRDVVLNLKKSEVCQNWEAVDAAFSRAIDYLTTSCNIPGSAFLPYDAMILPYVYYFFHHEPRVESQHARLLQDYFWRAGIAQRYTEGMVGKLTQDIAYVKSIIDGRADASNLPPIDISYQKIVNDGTYSTTSAYCKTILCLLAAKHPRSFDTDNAVKLDSTWLSKENAKNNHHFFPKAFVRKKEPGLNKLVNHSVNITLLDNYLNATIIKDRAPSDYIEEFESQNPELTSTLGTHLIGELNEFGITTDDYMKFFKARVKRIQEEIRKRIIKRNGDVLK